MKKNLLFASLLIALPALADEAQIRKAIEAKLGGVKVDGIQPAPVAGIFEVRFQSRDAWLRRASRSSGTPRT